MKSVIRPLLEIAAAVCVSALPLLTASGQDLYGCNRPTGMPPVPDGSIASLDEMQLAREAVETFLDEGEAFLSCLAAFPQDPVAATIRQQVAQEMDLVVVRFNDALCVYTDREECAPPAEAAAPSPSSPAAQVGAAIETLTSDSSETAERNAGYPATDGAGSTVVSEEASGLDTGTLLSGSVDQPADGWTAATVREPSLPDGTPCGSVTETRNDTTGEGPSLRAHHAWDVYNACIDPIQMRWTFRGDGVLDAERTIPGRGSQRIGCSTNAGTTFSRYCMGGIEYLFEWP